MGDIYSGAPVQSPAKEAIGPMAQAATGALDLPYVRDAIRTGANVIGRGASRIGEALSGVPARDIQNLFENPGTLFTVGSKSKAGQAIGEAKAAAGINPGVTTNAATLTPENVASAMNVKLTGKDALDAVVNGDRTPEKIGDALKYVSDEIKGRLSQGKDASELINIQGHLNNFLSEASPEIQAARQAYAPIAQRNKFLQGAPVNKNGTISKANLLYLSSLAGGLGASLGGGRGAAEAVLGAAIARAPLTTGLITSGVGATAKLVSNDAIRRAALASFIDKYTTKDGQ
jgi:hypothetical protein